MDKFKLDKFKVDLKNDKVVQKLREYKHRPSKPFAIMCKDIEQVQKLVKSLAFDEYLRDSSIDILAKEKSTGAFVVIELKRNQTSDDTVGQLARYMGWISEKYETTNVSGIIVAGSYDRKLDYAMKMLPACKVFLYKVNFSLEEFR